MSESPFEKLYGYFDQYLHLGAAARQEIERSFKLERIAKNTLLIRPGEVENDVGFLAQGSCRYYHFKNRKEITHWFGFEGMLVTSFHSLTTQEPSTEYIRFTEKSLLLVIPRHDLLELVLKYPEWQRLSALIVEDYARRLMKRITTFQTLSATQKYLQLLQFEPLIVQKMPLGAIASYLNITQETLSRIRSQIRSR